MIKHVILALTLLLALTSMAFGTLYQEGTIVYDDSLDVTWLLDANYIVTSGYTATKGNMNNTGAVTWSQATTWVNSLTLSDGTAWRLPTISELTSGYGSYGELGTMYYDYLDNVADDTSFSMRAANPNYEAVTFINIQRLGYWTGTQSDFGSRYKWVYNFSNGASDVIEKQAARCVWTVHDGDLRTDKVLIATWQGDPITWQGEQVLW